MTVIESHACNRHTPAVRCDLMGGEAWNPWRDLRAREHLDFRLAPLPHDLGAVYWPRGDRAAIVIDPDLTLEERNVALAHELVHDERGGGCDGSWMPAGWQVVAAREEGVVQREVARRLVPLDELDDYVARRIDSDIPTTPLDVAEEFGTTEKLAELAMLLLKAARP